MYIKNIYMAPPVAYERQACLGIFNTTRLLCSKVSKLGRPSINKISVTLSHLLKPKKHFNTFVITQLEFGQAHSIVVRPQASIIQADTICPEQNQFHFMQTFNKTSYQQICSHEHICVFLSRCIIIIFPVRKYYVP